MKADHLKGLVTSETVVFASRQVGCGLCDNRNCQLAPSQFVANGLQIFVDKRWTEVPSDKINTWRHRRRALVRVC